MICDLFVFVALCVLVSCPDTEASNSSNQTNCEKEMRDEITSIQVLHQRVQQIDNFSQLNKA